MEFLKYGADPYLKDYANQTVMHLTAQGGFVGLFVFFYSTLPLSITERDCNSYTPLHLAVMEGHENMSLFLIAKTENLEIADCKGYTPLHWTAFSSSYKIARHLVMRGANRLAVCNHGQTPEQLAQSRGFTDMLKVLVKPMQKTPPLIGNPCKPPLEKSGRGRFYIYAGFVPARVAVLLLMVPFVLSPYGICAALAMAALDYVLFFYVSCVDPGFMHEKTTVAELYATVKPDFICPYCVAKKVHTTVHCHHCHRCVKMFDHHCPWINNCVGEGNHKVFVFFLIVLVLDLATTAVLGFLHFWEVSFKKKKVIPIEQNSYAGLVLSVLCCGVILLVMPILYIQLANCFSKKTTHQKYAFRKNGVFSSLTSTSSILIKDSEDWSYFSKKEEQSEFDEPGCCRKVVLPPSLSQTSNINEEVE
jgi:palmitoyltransferase ZDHHC13/17